MWRCFCCRGSGCCHLTPRCSCSTCFHISIKTWFIDRNTTFKKMHIHIAPFDDLIMAFLNVFFAWSCIRPASSLLRTKVTFISHKLVYYELSNIKTFKTVCEHLESILNVCICVSVKKTQLDFYIFLAILISVSLAISFIIII